MSFIQFLLKVTWKTARVHPKLVYSRGRDEEQKLAMSRKQCQSRKEWRDRKEEKKRQEQKSFGCTTWSISRQGKGSKRQHDATMEATVHRFFSEFADVVSLCSFLHLFSSFLLAFCFRRSHSRLVRHQFSRCSNAVATGESASPLLLSTFRVPVRYLCAHFSWTARPNSDDTTIDCSIKVNDESARTPPQAFRGTLPPLSLPPFRRPCDDIPADDLCECQSLAQFLASQNLTST